MSIDAERHQLHTAGGEEFYSPAANQLVFAAQTGEAYRALAERLRQAGYFLMTLFANDERELTDNSFKVYAVLSHPAQDVIVTLMFPIGRGMTEYPSLAGLFAAAAPFECEIAEHFGLTPLGHPGSSIGFCPSDYPTDLYALRRTTRISALHAALAAFDAHPSFPGAERIEPAPLPSGELELPIGPIHAGVIEPGHFRFRIGGEAIERLDVRLGYTHKGVERLFQINSTLRDGWKLAQHVVGDSAVAHALAYCRALESLAGTKTPRPAQLLRVLGLELERLYNHIGDCAALAHDVAFDLPAAEMSAARECLLRLNQRFSGHRLLRGLVRPGGAMLPSPIDRDDVRATVDRAVSDFLPVAQFLSTHADFRNRLMGVGVLDRALAEQVGATGLAARASGLFRDFRRLHPTGAESIAEIRACLDEATLKDDPYAAGEQIVGDAFARYATRVAEVSVSARIVDRVLRAWDADWQATEFCADVNLRSAPNFRFGLGYAESWRGPVVYWLMKDKFEQIYRCKVCDPSMLNWPALKAAVEPHVDPKRATEHHTILLADFPIVNKSFNLSYAGNDL